MTTAAHDTEFAIPAGARDHEVVAEAVVERDSLLYEMSPHMHFRGARLRIEASQEATTPLLDNIRFDEPFGRQLALLCDGRRSRTELVTEMTERVARGELPKELPEGPIPDPETLRNMVAERVTECLDRIARYALFVPN